MLEVLAHRSHARERSGLPEPHFSQSLGRSSGTDSLVGSNFRKSAGPNRETARRTSAFILSSRMPKYSAAKLPDAKEIRSTASASFGTRGFSLRHCAARSLPRRKVRALSSRSAAHDEML